LLTFITHNDTGSDTLSQVGDCLQPSVATVRGKQINDDGTDWALTALTTHSAK